MKGSTEIKSIKRNTFFLFIGLTILFGFSLLFNISNEKKTTTEYAKIEAIANFNNDLLYRRWATIHGGVYVPVTDLTPPNPALKHIPERDIKTESGRELTLVNPAYMARQVYELEDEQSGIKAHITSLNPIRPENKADEWETNALNEFRKGKLEYYSYETINGAEYFRYMAALKTEKGCLKCHSSQGYKLGDIRGGISVSVPMEKYYNAAGEHVSSLILTYSVVFFVVIFLGFIGYRKNLNAIYKGEFARNEIINSEAKLKLVTENISDVVWIIDFETNEFRYVSPSVEKFNGFTQEEMMALGLIPQITPSSLEYLSSKIPQRIERFKQGIDEEFVDQLEQNHKDGSTFWTEVKARYIKNIKTGRVEIVGVSHDISEQKNYQQELLRAKEQAEESEIKYRSIFSNMMNAFGLHEMIFDENGAPLDYVFLEVNPIWEEIVGIKAKDVLGKRIKEIMPNIEQSWIDKYGKVVLSGVPEEFIDYNEATQKHYNVSAYRHEGNKFAVFFNDVTNRIIAEKELLKAKEKAEESDERHKFLFDNTIQGVVYENQNGEIIYANKAAERILGLSLDQMQGRKSIDSRWKAIHEDGSEYPGGTHPAMIALQTGEIQNNKIMGVFSPSENDYTWININSFPKFKDGVEKPSQVVSTFEDITSIRKNTKDLLRAKEKAEESERLKSVFLANMSHEIRTPMNGIMGFADLLDDPDTKQEEREKYTSIIKSNGDRLLELMNNLIDYSKVEAGQMMISKTKVDIPAIFERLDGMFHSEIIKKKIDLNFAIDSLPQHVFTDSIFLESVLINLIKNAIKFTTKGGIAVTCKKDNGGLIFCVQDTGIGVKLENINSIFERFNQEDVSLTKKYEGAGLGLAISKSYIEILGGKIWAESDLGVGSRFFFTIPL